MKNVQIERFRAEDLRIDNDLKQLDEERPNDFPDSHKNHARQIVDAMVDENKGYEQAKDELYNGKSKEMEENEKEDQKVMGENPRGRR